MYRHVAIYHLDLAQLWWCPGARCGRACHRIAWIMFGGRMMYHGTLSQPVWRRLSPRGQFGARFLTCLRVSVSRAAGQSRRDTISPVTSSPGLTETSRLTRRDRRWLRPVRILEESVSELPTLTAQDPSDLQGALVYDCRPPLLPVSL